MTAPAGTPAERILEWVEICDDIEDYKDVVELVRDCPGDVVELLRVARHDDLAAVTARSYRHPNGFAKIVLHDAGPAGASIRLHVWPTAGVHEQFEDVPRGDTAPHEHRWKFASTVLAGSGLLVEEFTGDRSGVLHDRFVFEPTVRAELRADGDARLASRGFWVRNRDDVYGCDTDIIHTVAPIDHGMTATLVVQGPVEEAGALVFLRPGAPPDPCRAPLDEALVASLIDEVIAEIVMSAVGRRWTWTPQFPESPRPQRHAATPFATYSRTRVGRDGADREIDGVGRGGRVDFSAL